MHSGLCKRVHQIAFLVLPLVFDALHNLPITLLLYDSAAAVSLHNISSLKNPQGGPESHPGVQYEKHYKVKLSGMNMQVAQAIFGTANGQDCIKDAA